MKAKLEFNLDDLHESERFRRVMAADSMAEVLWDLCHDDRVPTDVRDFVVTCCNDAHIHFEQIYT